MAVAADSFTVFCVLDTIRHLRWDNAEIAYSKETSISLAAKTDLYPRYLPIPGVGGGTAALLAAEGKDRGDLIL